jgi:hypothetical protein
MTSGFSGSIPPPITRAGLQASLNDVLVRLVVLPDTLRDNPSPVRLTGTVTGQNPDGSLNITTDRGVVTLLLKDRQGLPAGQMIEVDIPAGRPPAQAALRPAAAAAPNPTLTANAPPVVTAPVIASDNPLSAAQASVALRVDRTTSNPQQVQEIITTALTQAAQDGAERAPSALQLQQAVRLNLTNTSQLPPLQAMPQQNISSDEMVISLIRNLVQLPESQTILKSDTVRFLMGSGVLNNAAITSSPAFQNLQPQFQKMIQVLGLPQQSNSATPLPLSSAQPVADMRVMGIILPPQNTQNMPINQITPSSPLPQLISIATAAQADVPQTGTGQMPAQIIAQVVGLTHKNFPVLQFVTHNAPPPMAGSLPSQAAPMAILNFPTHNLPVGSLVFLNTLPASQSSLTVPFTAGGWMANPTWPELQELITQLHTTAPAMAVHLNQILPSTTQPQNLGALALFVLNVLRSGDVEQMFPQHILQALRQSMKTDNLRTPLDSAMLTRIESMALPNDWRASVFPLWHDHQLHKLPVYWKRMQEDDGQKDREKRQKLMRFLFDLKLSRMGDVQVDGFLQTARLDMILRTKQPLSVPMQQTMRLGYTKAMERSQMTGELSFQFRLDQWVTMDMPLEMA